MFNEVYFALEIQTTKRAKQIKFYPYLIEVYEEFKKVKKYFDNINLEDSNEVVNYWGDLINIKVKLFYHGVPEDLGKDYCLSIYNSREKRLFERI